MTQPFRARRSSRVERPTGDAALREENAYLREKLAAMTARCGQLSELRDAVRMWERERGNGGGSLAHVRADANLIAAFRRCEGAGR